MNELGSAYVQEVKFAYHKNIITKYIEVFFITMLFCFLHRVQLFLSSWILNWHCIVMRSSLIHPVLLSFKPTTGELITSQIESSLNMHFMES